jgi:hypothetical protein
MPDGTTDEAAQPVEAPERFVGVDTTAEPTATLDDGSAPRGRLSSLLQELRQRRVYRATMTYALAVWLVLQIADVAFPVLGLPDRVMVMLIAAGAAGLPMAIILAWAFEWTPGGLIVDTPRSARARQVPPGDLTVNTTLLLLGITVAALLSLPFLTWQPSWSSSGPEPRLVINVRSGGAPTASATALARQFERELRHRFAAQDGVAVTDHIQAAGNPAPRTLLLTVDLLLLHRAIHVMVRLVDADTGVFLQSHFFEATHLTALAVVDLIAREVGQVLARADAARVKDLAAGWDNLPVHNSHWLRNSAGT